MTENKDWVFSFFSQFWRPKVRIQSVSMVPALPEGLEVKAGLAGLSHSRWLSASLS